MMSPVQPSLGECRIDAVTVQRACFQSLSNKNLRTHKQMNDGSFIFKLFTRLMVGGGGLREDGRRRGTDADRIFANTWVMNWGCRTKRKSEQRSKHLKMPIPSSQHLVTSSPPQRWQRVPSVTSTSPVGPRLTEPVTLAGESSG